MQVWNKEAGFKIPSLPVSPSAKGEGIHQPAGRSREDFQLAAGDGGSIRPRPNHPGNPADLSGLEVVKRWGLLSADQTNQSRPAPQQSCQPRPLAPPDLYELHLPAQPRHPTLPQVSPQKVQCIFNAVPLIHNNPVVTHDSWLKLPLHCRLLFISLQG